MLCLPPPSIYSSGNITDMILRSIRSGWGNVLDGREGQRGLVFTSELQCAAECKRSRMRKQSERAYGGQIIEGWRNHLQHVCLPKHQGGDDGEAGGFMGSVVLI